MEFEFAIPVKNSDLFNTSGNFYRATEVQEKHIVRYLKDAYNVYKSSNAFFIFDHFDTYLSAIENRKALTIIELLKLFDNLYDIVDNAGKLMVNFWKTVSEPTESQRNRHLNLVKMCTFLIINTVDTINNRINVDDSTDTAFPKKNKNKLNKSLDVDLPKWNRKREEFLIQLQNILKLPLEKLWDPPVAEDTFIKMITEAAYKSLSDPSIKEFPNVGDSAFLVLGIALKQYNHSAVFTIKMLQLIVAGEFTAIPIVRGIKILHDNFNITSVFEILVNDLIEGVIAVANDTIQLKLFCNFFNEMGTTAGKILLPQLSDMAAELLNVDAFTLRNCILDIIGKVLINEITPEEAEGNYKELRDEFLEHLFNHTMDVSAHVRSKALHIWLELKQASSIPIIYDLKILKRAVERLEDKTATVRKSAAILIRSFVEYNPFSSQLSDEQLKEKLTAEEAKLFEMKKNENPSTNNLDELWESVKDELFSIIQESLSQSTQEHEDPNENCEDVTSRIIFFFRNQKLKEAVDLVKRADYVAGNREDRINLPFDQQCGYYMLLIQSYLFLQKTVETSEEQLRQENIVSFLKDTIEFSEIITGVVLKFEEMLNSKTNSDVSEAVEFFTTGYKFAVTNSTKGMQKMLYLVWSTDKEKRDVVTLAYKKILFITDYSGRSHAIKVVDNLCNFYEKLPTGLKSAFEILIREWCDDEDIDADVIKVLFERFTMKIEGTSDNQSRLCLAILKLIAKTNTLVCTSNLQLFEEYAFETKGLRDHRLFTSCINLMSHQNGEKSDPKEIQKRFEAYHPIVTKIKDSYEHWFWQPNIKNFDPISCAVVDFYYKLCQQPDHLCHTLVYSLSKRLVELSKDETSETENELVLIPYLTRIIVLVGYIAMKDMIFLDMDVYNNLKLRQNLKYEQKKKSHNASHKTMNSSASSALKRQSGVNSLDDHEQDDMLVGTTAEDTIAELINNICENDLLYASTGLLPHYCMIIQDILKNPHIYTDQELQQAASCTLIRFMTISSKFCEENLHLLMNLLKQSKNISIRCNIVIGLADITFRFPNVIESWTSHLYSILHESDVKLRLTAVKMLTHLIYHEMIRVKGQISDVAMCIVDDNEEIRHITIRFFKEIANKANILYNVLPDIISSISEMDDEIKYRTIMKYILGLINKDRQIEGLVEKLCMRFKVTTTERQWRDIGFCLTLLNYTDKSIKKLMDNIPSFKDKLYVQEVQDSFKTIITNTGKLAKPEMKALLSELQDRIDECLKIKDHDTPSDKTIANQTIEQSQKVATSQRVKATATSQRKPVRGRKKVQSSSSSEEEESNSESSEDEQPIFKTPKQPAPRKGTARNNRGTPSSSASASSSSQSASRSPKCKISKRK